MNKISIEFSILLFVVVASNLHAQGEWWQPSKLYYGVEYLNPVTDDRNIETYNIDVYHPFLEYKHISLKVFTGFTFTYASGDITQLQGELDKGTLREVNYKNSAFGIGPGLLVDWKLPIYNKISFHLEGIGNLIIYNEDFPAGGDIYNFMWRGGPLIQYEFSKSFAIGLDYFWAHISNGQGIVPENPSYNAQGISIRFTGIF